MDIPTSKSTEGNRALDDLRKNFVEKKGYDSFVFGWI